MMWRHKCTFSDGELQLLDGWLPRGLGFLFIVFQFIERLLVSFLSCNSCKHFSFCSCCIQLSGFKSKTGYCVLFCISLNPPEGFCGSGGKAKVM